MITESHMHMLQSELRELRQRLAAGKTDEAYIAGLHEMTRRMLEAGQGSSFEPALSQVHKLMAVIMQGERRRNHQGSADAEAAAIKDYFKS